MCKYPAIFSSQFGEVESRFSDDTMDCLTWKPVTLLDHNKQALEGAEIALTELQSEDSEHRRKSFAKVYDNNEWDPNVKSGGGSLVENSLVVIRTLNLVVEKIKKKTGKGNHQLFGLLLWRHDLDANIPRQQN